jgi:hypothetical protein
MSASHRASFDEALVWGLVCRVFLACSRYFTVFGGTQISLATVSDFSVAAAGDDSDAQRVRLGAWQAAQSTSHASLRSDSSYCVWTAIVMLSACLVAFLNVFHLFFLVRLSLLSLRFISAIFSVFFAVYLCCVSCVIFAVFSAVLVSSLRSAYGFSSFIVCLEQSFAMSVHSETYVQKISSANGITFALFSLFISISLLSCLRGMRYCSLVSYRSQTSRYEAESNITFSQSQHQRVRISTRLKYCD